MNLDVKRYVQGAKEARGTCVVIDVFRASNTVMSLLSRGPHCIIPVACLSVANLVKQENPDYILIGERGGKTLEGFDHDNSPTAVLGLDLAGRTVILATSAGSKVIAHARLTDEVIVASFANARAVADYVRVARPEQATILVAGHNGETEAEEDEACAAYIGALIRGEEPEDFWGRVRERLLRSPGAERLRSLGQEADLEYCLRLDCTDIVPRASKGLGLWRFRPPEQ
ncbi:MAG: 2-phosphosulfolactate phosphatase [Pseudomonadota bacterium]